MKRFRASKLCVQPRSDNRDRAAIAVIGWIGDELIIEGHAPGEHGEAVVHLDDLFGAGIWQPTIADENAEAACIEKGLVHR